MRTLSDLEIALVSGGEGETVVVTGKRSQSTDSATAALQIANNLHFDTGAGIRIATEGSSCAGAISKVQKSPTYTNAALAASACGAAITDVINSTDWDGLSKTWAAISIAEADARSFGMIKQKSK